jgi:virulence-associated protein VapD
MNQPDINIETFGYIKKEESLVTVENNIIPNTLVLESLQPFPGYHGNFPDKSQPRSLFLITTKDYSFEEVARITKNICESIKFNFNASQGHIYFKSETLPCIRIKYLRSFTFIPELQNYYKDADIKFAKQRQINDSALIVINKSFFVADKGDGLYKDLDDESKCYFELPAFLSWDQFKKYTENIKYNIDNINFDAAQGVFFRKTGIKEIVRIFDQEKTPERIMLLHKAYLEEIRKNS